MAAGTRNETDPAPSAPSQTPESGASKPTSAVVPALAVGEGEDDGEVEAIPDVSDDILAERPVSSAAAPTLSAEDDPSEPSQPADVDARAGEPDEQTPSDPAALVGGATVEADAQRELPPEAEAPPAADAEPPSETAPEPPPEAAPEPGPSAEAEPPPEAAPEPGPPAEAEPDESTSGAPEAHPSPPEAASSSGAGESEAPASEAPAVRARSSGPSADLPAFEAPDVPAGPAGDNEPLLTAFPEPARSPFADAPARAPRPSRVRPGLRVPRRSERATLPRPVPSQTAIGIDLGTTNCCAAVVSDGTAYVLTSRLGTSTMPSAVSFTSDGDVLIGQPALDRLAQAPAHTITGSKRLIGRPYHSALVQDVRNHIAYTIVEGDEGEAAVDIGGGDIVSLEEVSAYLLREVRASASLLLGESVTRAVITCPAFYNERQREAVRTAGELAGFIVERVLSEPTAAALNFGYGRDLSTRRVAVYDLGGGTFDVSILELNGTVYEVMATGGDTFLGGVDFDATIAKIAVERLVAQGAPDPRRDAGALSQLMEAAEKAKRALADRPSTILHVPALRVGSADPFEVSLPLRRDELDPRLRPLLERTLEIVGDVCRRAGLEPGDVDDVLLVGGQTRYPAVADCVARIFGRRPRATINPDEAVALGAAQYAVGMNTIDNVVLIDALPMSIGVGLPGGRFLPILSRDQRLPAKGSCMLPTSKKNQRSMEVWIFQGEGPSIADTEPLGRLEIQGLPPGPIGSTTVVIEARVDGESILEVRARDQSGGKTFTSRFATRSTPPELREKLGLPEPPRGRPRSGRPSAWSWLTSLFR